MHYFSPRIDTVCNAFGAAILALFAAAPLHAEAPSNNYPTVARVEYVQECLNRAAGPTANLYSCSCVIDRIAEKLGYDDYVEDSTFAKYATLPGEGGGIFRDTDEAKQKAKLFRSIESDAYRACNLSMSTPGPKS
jgi:hypothetical protein